MAQISSKLPSHSSGGGGASSSSSTSGPTVPPKSKLQPYYSISPLWTDVEPIPQIDAAPGIPDSVPVLAAIAYTPRYAEAMSYLRAVMAANEFSERCLALTEDLIGMNPAHYTVWIYRMRILKHLWGVLAPDSDGGGSSEGAPPPPSQEELEKHVMKELSWLNSVSARNLKNYQIWHHRQALVDLLSPSTESTFFSTEQAFLRQILSLDTKNYHVWSYRQWLCTRFPNPLLTTSTELAAMDEMILDDIRNNSAWNHRYFVVFGHKELQAAEQAGKPLKDVKMVKMVDEAVVQRELEYTQAKIRLAPQNGSSWNYLKGVLRHKEHTKASDLREFCEEFIGEEGDLWSENRPEKRGVRSSHAVEWLSDIYAQDGTGEGRARAKECLKSLGEKWDPIREKYWQYRLRGLEDQWKEGKEEEKHP